MLNVPSLNRRRLLLGLASASAGAAAAAAGVAVAVTEPAAAEVPYTPENLALLALGDDLPAVIAERDAAHAAYSQMVKHWSPRWPVAPEAIAIRHYNTSWEERGFVGQPILADGSTYRIPQGQALYEPHPKPRQIMTAEHIEWRIHRLDQFLKRRRPKHPLAQEQIGEATRERAEWAAKLTLARTYEAQKAAVREGSKYDAVCARRDAADEAMVDFVSKVMAETPVTMAGVLIQAQALEAFGSSVWMVLKPESWGWRQSFASTLLRIARETPANQA